MPLATCQQEKRASGQEGCGPRDRVTAALAGVRLGRAGTPRERGRSLDLSPLQRV